jgi:hypothetical protein
VYRIILLWAILLIGVVASLPGQSLEVCGVSYRLGMTRAEVKKKATFPEGKWTPEAREDFLNMWYGKDSVVLTGATLGLPETTKCSGFLIFKNDRIIEIDKDVRETTNALQLARAVFFELEKASQIKGASPIIRTATRKVEDSDMMRQLIWFDFGDYVVMMSADEGDALGHHIASGSVSIGVVDRKR